MNAGIVHTVGCSWMDSSTVGLLRGCKLPELWAVCNARGRAMVVARVRRLKAAKTIV